MLRLEQGRVIGLVNLVRREVCCIDVAREAWLKRSANPPERVEFDATEEGVPLDLVSTAATQAVLGVADEAVKWSDIFAVNDRGGRLFRPIPSNQVLCLCAQGYVVREVQALPPVDNLAVRVMAVLSTERRPTDQALEHDSSQTPPIAVEAVAVASEDFGGNIIRRSDGGVSH